LTSLLRYYHDSLDSLNTVFDSLHTVYFQSVDQTVYVNTCYKQTNYENVAFSNFNELFLNIYS